MKSQLLLVLFSMLSMFVGCERQQEHGDIVFRGLSTFPNRDGNYHGFCESRRGLVDLLIIINDAKCGFSRIYVSPGPAVYTITVSEKDYKFVIIPDYQKGEVTIDGKIFKMTNGIVFLCDVSNDHVKVKQVAQRAGKVPHDNVYRKIEPFVKRNSIIKEFIERGGLGEGESD